MPLQPWNSTVTVDGNKFNAESAHVGIETIRDDAGMPMMGTQRYLIECSVDAHDTTNLPFGTLSRLFDLANIVSRDKVVDIKCEFWQDESQQNAICTFSFRGWISEFHVAGGGGGNHSLHITFVPALDNNQYVDLTIGN